MSVVGSIVGAGSSILGGKSAGDHARETNAVAGVIKNVLGDAKSGIIGGIRKSIGGYFSGFKQGGFKCLGKQAFHEGDLNSAMNVIQNEVATVDFGNAPFVAEYLSVRELEIAHHERVINVYKSPCSKENTRRYIDFLRGLINEIIDKSPYKFEVGQRQGNLLGVDYLHKSYTYVGNKNSGISILSNPTPDVDVPVVDTGENELMGNLLDNIDPALYTPSYIPPENEIEGLEFVRTTGDPTWNIGGGGRTKDGIDWSFGAGKQQDNTVQLLLIGMFGLLAYKVLFDRR